MMQAMAQERNRRFAAMAVIALLALAAAALALWPAPAAQGQDSATVTFSPSSIPDKTYTQGAYVPKGDPAATATNNPNLPYNPPNPRWEALRLPEATVTSPTGVGWAVTYSITGLPDGLTFDPIDRIIRGTPTTVTTTPATVTYTANATTWSVSGGSMGTPIAVTDGVSGSASLTFTITVVAPPAFDAEARRLVSTRIIAWVNNGWTNSGSDNTITFPAASGGHGALTYYLFDNQTGQALYAVEENQVRTGITFNRATRVLGGTPNVWARKAWPVSYYAEDENGSRASLYFTIYAGGYAGAGTNPGDWTPNPPVGGL